MDVCVCVLINSESLFVLRKLLLVITLYFSLQRQDTLECMHILILRVCAASLALRCSKCLVLKSTSGNTAIS